jgi:hypothetical protein
MLQVEDIEQQFGKLHLLIDRLFENQSNMTQNSNMFQVRFALLLSSLVQMKNSLIKSLEHEAKEQQPDLRCWTQKPIIDLNPEQLANYMLVGPKNEHGEDDEDFLTVYTP